MVYGSMDGSESVQLAPGEAPIYCTTALQQTGLIHPERRLPISLQFQNAPSNGIRYPRRMGDQN